MKQFRFSTPQWANDIIKPGGTFEQIDRFFYSHRTRTTKMKKFRSGFLLKDILDRSKQFMGNQRVELPNLWLYFAHDITIDDMLNSLGLSMVSIHFEIEPKRKRSDLIGLCFLKPSLPPYASCLFFELYKNETNYYLQIFYRNSTTALNVPALEIPNCGAKCPLNSWYAIYKEILPTKSHEMECAK